MVEFTNSQIDLFIKSYSKQIYGLTIKNARIAQIVNRITKHYSLDTIFQHGEEPCFKITKAQIEQVAAISNTDPFWQFILSQINKEY